MLGGLPRTLFPCCKLSNLPYDADGAALEQWLVLSASPPCFSVTGAGLMPGLGAGVFAAAGAPLVVIAQRSILPGIAGGRPGRRRVLRDRHFVCFIWLALLKVGTAQA